MARTAVFPRSRDDAELLARLDEEHRLLEARLAELGRHISLTSAEKLEYAELKKRKLFMKDRRASLVCSRA